jgi:hypothetical protein
MHKDIYIYHIAQVTRVREGRRVIDYAQTFQITL